MPYNIPETFRDFLDMKEPPIYKRKVSANVSVSDFDLGLSPQKKDPYTSVKKSHTDAST